MQLDGDGANVELLFRRPDDHLQAELHAVRAEVEARQRRAAHASHSAVRVAHVRAVDLVDEPRQERVADVLVEPGHRPVVDAMEAVAHDEVAPTIELVDEARNIAEVVRQVRVAHHDVVTPCGGESGEIRVAVSAARLLHDTRTYRPCEIAAAVGRPVVDDDHLSGNAVLVEHLPRQPHALLDVHRLVEARDDHRHSDAVGDRRNCGATFGERGHRAWSRLGASEIVRLASHRFGFTKRRLACLAAPAVTCRLG